MYILPDALAPLAAWRQFILVRIAPKPGQPGKTQKYSSWPYDQPTTATGDNGTYTVCKGDKFDAHDACGWLDCQTAAAIAASMPITGDTIAWTVGFVLTSADPFWCLDQDNCLTLTGTWSEQSLGMLQRLPGAVEVSQSGTGLHTWGWYTGATPEHGKRNAKLGIELYTEKRFIALSGTATGVMGDATAALHAVVTEYFPPLPELNTDGEDWTTQPVPEYTHIDDEPMLELARSRTRRSDAAHVFGEGRPVPQFADLWDRNAAALALSYLPDGPGKEFGYSEADFGLAKELAYWTGKDCARIERLMRASGLARDKWDEGRPGGTLLMQTVRRAVAACTQVYHREAAELPDGPAAGMVPVPVAITHNTYIAREDLGSLFAGCVYIQDNNAVLLPNGDMVDQGRFNAKFGGYTFGMDDACTKSVKSAWDAFLNNQVIRFPRAEGTEFNPRLPFQQVVERAGRAWVNVYQPPEVKRRPGDVAPFMDLMRRILPHGDDALILISYMAAVCQYPGVKFRWAPFIQGTRGNGKSTIVECLKHALGHRYVFTLKAGMIENGFNAWLEHNLLYVADDIYTTRDRTDMMEALKSLITGRDHAITLKGIDSVLKRICGNFIFMDNHKDAMKRQEDSRDLCTLYCAQQSPADRARDGLTKAYFKTLYDWLDAGGYEHVAEMLHTMEIDERFNPAGECQEAPVTSTAMQAVVDGRTGIEAEVAELIELEEPGFCGGFVSYHMLKKRFEDSKRSLGPLKATEMLQRLGYEKHPYLKDGRLPRHVMPDNTRPVLYVKRDAWLAGLCDPELVGAFYVAAQTAAMTAQVNRQFNGS